jgi:glycosyltransferase involved in cell wall biosynthesis
MMTRSTPQHGGGGMERVAWDLGRRWLAEGHNVTCVTTPLAEQGPDGCEPTRWVDGILVHHVDGRPGSYSGGWRRRAAAFVDELDWDVVLSVSSAAHALVRRGTPGRVVVMQAHGTAWAEVVSAWRGTGWKAPVRAVRMARGLWLDALAYRSYATVVAVGDGIAAELSRWPRVLRPRRVELIRNGVAPSPDAVDVRAVRAELGVEPHRPLAVFAGRLVDDKGPDRAIEAARLAGWQLRVFGDGPLRGRIAELLEGSGEEPSRVVRGWVDSDHLRQALAAADLLLLSSRRVEGLPLVALEAVASGTPVLAGEQNRSSLAALAGAVTFARCDGPSLAAAMRAHRPPPGGAALAADLSAAGVADKYLELFTQLRNGGA